MTWLLAGTRAGSEGSILTLCGGWCREVERRRLLAGWMGSQWKSVILTNSKLSLFIVVVYVKRSFIVYFLNN